MIHETLYGIYEQPNGGPKFQFYQFCIVLLNNVFNAFFVIYLPVINASDGRVDHYMYLPCIFRAFYDLFAVLTGRAVLICQTTCRSCMLIKRLSRAMSFITISQTGPFCLYCSFIN
jgi:hypothetical protein